MATKTAILAVKIVSDAKDFSKGMDDSVSKLDKFQNKIGKLTMPATAILGGLTAIGAGFLSAASEAEQAQGGVEAVFGKWSKDVDKFASDSANRLGLSGAAYDQLASQIGNSLKNAGIPMDQLAKKTDELSSLGADLSSVFGGTTSEAVNAMGAAFRGEYDSLERFGIILNDSTIMAALKEKGLDKLTGSALSAAKQQEVYNQLMEQGAPFMGNFAKEADTAAGAQERLKAQFEDVSAQLGTALLPYMVQLAEAGVGLATWVSENTGTVQAFAVGLGILAAAVLVLNGVLLVMNVIAATNPWVILAVGVAALVAGIIYLATQTQFFQNIFGAMGSFVGGVINNIKNFLNGLGASAQNTANNMRNAIVGAWNNISSFVSGIINNIVSFIVRIAISVAQTVQNAQNAFRAAFSYIQSVASGVINNIVGFFGRISGAVQGAISWVRSLFNMGGMPGWLKGVLGMGGTGFDVTGDFGFAAAPEGGLGIGATGGLSGASMFGSKSGPAVESTVVNITVNGALDPDAVARQIDGIMNRYRRNNGTIAAGGNY